MPSLTSSSWQGGKNKKRSRKVSRPAASPAKPARKKEKSAKEPKAPRAAKPTKSVKMPKAKPQKPARVKRESSGILKKILPIILVLILLAGAGYYAWSKDMIPEFSKSDTDTAEIMSRDDSTGSSVKDEDAQDENMDTPTEQPKPTLTPSELASAVNASYTEAITTEGTSEVNGETMTFKTTWFQDASNGEGTITWSGITAGIKIYKGTLLVNNDTGLLDKYTGKDIGVPGWTIITENTPFLRAFPGKAALAPLTIATQESMLVKDDTVTVENITATVKDGKITKYKTDTVDYSITSADVAAVVTVSGDTFKAAGKLSKDESGNWLGEQFER